MFGSETPPAIPDHELLRCIGSGNYGRVWLARNVMGTYRAVKVVQRRNFKLQRPFDREYAGIMKYEPVSRTHPGFVSILHVGINNTQGYFYYMMDLADDVATGQEINPDTYQARTLASDKERQERLPVADCLLVGTVLASALATLHKRGLVHRDIKPTNIIFVNGTPKFADIGLVTEIGESGTFVGSEGYVPPEGPGKPTADIFGLGKVLFEILTGQHQLEYPNAPEGFDQLPDATERRRILEVVAHCCEPNPNKRFQNARELHERLEAIQASLRQRGAATPGGPAAEIDTPPKQVVLIGETRPERFGGFPGVIRTELARARCQVFVDQTTGVDAEWARQIEQQIAKADAVVALLSADSGQSETLAYELSLAHAEAQRSNGRPRLICVNLELAGTVPPEILELAGSNATLLDSRDAGSPTELAGRIVNALQSVAGYTPTQERPRLETVGGAVPLTSDFYIKRPADERLDAAISSGESLVLIKGARQIGKTSLLARGLQRAREEGFKVILTDCQKLNAASFESIESFFFGLGTSLADQLDLDVLIEDNWDSRRTPNFNFERYLKREVLGPLTSNLVWGIDEIDRLFPCPFRGEVFGLFRAWHNARALEPNSPWSRLTLAMAYATEVKLFITDHSQSPFNVGTRLELQDFTPDQVAELNRRYGSPLKSPADLAAFIGLVGGQPYLVRRGLHELASNNTPFAEFLADSDREEGVFGDHLRRLLMVIAREPHLHEALRQVARGQPLTDVDLFYRLRSAGFLAGTAPADAHLRCDLYRRYFAKAS